MTFFLSQVIGIVSIAMVGGAYCPLSSKDPPQRLQTLVDQVRSRLVMVHSATNTIFEVHIATFDIDAAVHINETWIDTNLDQLSTVSVTPEHNVFVIFTSGSTGTPKAVRILLIF
jgi:non-ribosomal peptide synthetase component F